MIEKIHQVEVPGLEFAVCQVTPQLAAEWLKRNTHNRKLKQSTLQAYERDIRNNAWLLTHQGVAFDEKGRLLDGHHRLHAVVASGQAVQIFVTAGWPAGGKQPVMDAVDRGCLRSLADQLHLQHGLPARDAVRVVQISNNLAATFLNYGRVRKSSTACVLAVYGAFAKEIKFVLDIPNEMARLRNATVSSGVALGYGLWPEKTADFYQRLLTGDNLSRDNPVLPLRNYLLGDGASADVQTLRAAFLHHLVAFVEGRKLAAIVVTSDAARQQMVRAYGARGQKIAKLFGEEGQTVSEHREETWSEIKSGSPVSPAALGVFRSLGSRFTTTDLRARVDNPSLVGMWLADWHRKGWVTPAGVNEFAKTETGKEKV